MRSASGAGHMPGFTFISAVGARGSVQENPGGSTRWAGLSGANSLSGVVARHPSGLMGAEEAPHDPDTGATGDPRMRFEEARGGWQERRLTREEAARGGCERTFRRYEDEGLDGLVDKRSGAKSRRPPAVPSSVERQVEEEPSLSGPSAPGRPGTEGRARGGRPPLAREPATVRSGRRGRSRSVRQEASCLWEFVSRVVGKTPDPLSVNELHEDLYTLRWAASNFATERVHVTGRRYSRKFNYLISNNFFVSVKDCQQLKTPLNHRGLLVVLGDLFTDFSTDFVESGGAAQAVNELVHESPTPHEMGARSGAERRGGSGARLPRFLAPRPVFGPAGRR